MFIENHTIINPNTHQNLGVNSLLSTLWDRRKIHVYPRLIISWKYFSSTSDWPWISTRSTKCLKLKTTCLRSTSLHLNKQNGSKNGKKKHFLCTWPKVINLFFSADFSCKWNSSFYQIWNTKINQYTFLAQLSIIFIL